MDGDPHDRPAPSPAELVAALSRRRGAGVLLGRLLDSGAVGRALVAVVRAPTRAPWAMARITRLHARLLRLSRGRMRRSWLFAAGQPVLSLTTTGRRSGAARTTPVAALVHRGRLATVGMNLGGDRDPAWALNLLADPDALVQVGARSFPVRARAVHGSERRELWERWLEVQPSAAALARAAGREPPIFVLETPPATRDDPGDRRERPAPTRVFGS